MRQILSNSDPTSIVDIIKRQTADILLFTWLSMSRLESNHDPKFFTFVEGLIFEIHQQQGVK